MRTPLLPFEEMLSWGGDQRSLRERLREVVARAEVKEALFLASPSLTSRMAYWVETPDGARGRKIEASLAAYYMRMCGRPTPTGLCAGITVGDVSHSTYCRLAPRGAYRRSTRIDGNYLKRLIDSLVAADDERGVIPYYPNSTWYRLGPSLRYSSGRPMLRLYSVEDSEYLARVLERAELGATRAELAEVLLQADADIGAEEAQSFIAELIREDILIADLEPPLTGGAPLHRQTAAISRAGEQVGRRFQTIGDSLRELDAEGIGLPPARYDAVLSSLPRVSESGGEASLFHAELIKPGELRIGGAVVKELQRAMGVLLRICDMEYGSTPLKTLRGFRDVFVSRYGSREVPLLEALDDDVGIGLRSTWPYRARGDASPILKGVGGGATPPSEKVVGSGFEHLLWRVEHALVNGESEIVIDEDDIRALDAGEPAPLPPSFCVLCSVVAPSAEAIDRGDFLLYWRYLVPGVRLLGRFAGLDPRLEANLRRLVDAQTAFFPNAIVADIVHQPDSLSGNVMQRPRLYDYEIPFVGRSDAPPSHQIHARDLLLSVEGERVVLRWQKTGAEVVPQIATAHQLELSIYADPVRLLSMLAWQYHGQYLAFQWRGLVETATWLPRVRIGRTIVSLATWYLRPIHLRALIDARSATPAARFRAVAKLRDDFRVPRWVSLVDADSPDRVTPIDLDNLFGIDELIAAAARGSMVTLNELVATDENGLWTAGPEGRFQHELVVPFVVDQPPCAPFTSPRKERSPAIPAAERTFVPGGEWLAVRLYTRRSQSNFVLRQLLPGLLRTGSDHAEIDRWFFSRTEERDYYLQFFLHGPPSDLRHSVLQRLHAAVEPLVAEGRCWKFELDTYSRDVEGNGGVAGALAAESIAHGDSIAVLSLLPYLDRGDTAELEWYFAVMSIDRMCGDFRLTLRQKMAFAERMRDERKAELVLSPASSWRIGDHYRTFKTTVAELLATPPARPGVSPMVDVLDARSRATAPVVEDLLAAERDRRLTRPVESILSNLARQHAARVFRSSSRLSEAVIYDFLARHYDGAMARTRS